MTRRPHYLKCCDLAYVNDQKKVIKLLFFKKSCLLLHHQIKHNTQNMKNSARQTRSKVLSIVVLIAVVISIVGCASPRCGYMKCYNRDVRMGIAR